MRASFSLSLDLSLSLFQKILKLSSSLSFHLSESNCYFNKLWALRKEVLSKTSDADSLATFLRRKTDFVLAPSVSLSNSSSSVCVGPTQCNPFLRVVTAVVFLTRSALLSVPSISDPGCRQLHCHLIAHCNTLTWSRLSLLVAVFSKPRERAKPGLVFPREINLERCSVSIYLFSVIV